MKKTASSIVAFLVTLVSISWADAASVKGYWRDTDRDGVKDTYVAPYQRTNPNSYRTDNYGYPGQYNPNRGSYTPQSSSPRELYPTNPSPYERKKSESLW